MFSDERDRLIGAVDAAHEQVGAAQRRLLALVAEVDRTEAWQGSGARDTAHWLAMRYGISSWKAHRWVGAAHALEELPRVAEALAGGDLSLDKTVELARFAEPQTEQGLVSWASEASSGAVRHRADVAVRREREEVADSEQDRSVTWWWFEEGRRFGLQAWLPAAQGQVVVRALERMAATVPVMPDEDDPYYQGARRADALVGLCSARVAADPDPDRATVVVHARLQDLQVAARGSDLGGSNGPARSAELEGGGVIAPETALRLLCDARVETIVEGEDGQALGVGRITREPPSWMVRQVRYRDRGCRFPGCGTKAFTQAHHVRFWRHGGPTDLSNLLLICSFHHRLVHEHGWSVKRKADGSVVWTTPEGTRYRAGPSPGGVSPLNQREPADDPIPIGDAVGERELALMAPG